MTGARLFLRRRNHPDIVGELACDRFQQPEPARVHAIVVGDQDAHRERYGGGITLLQPRTAAEGIAPYSQQLGDLFTKSVSVLVKLLVHNYSAGGDGRLSWVSPGRVSLNRLRLHRWPGRSRWRRMGRPRRDSWACAGRDIDGDRSSRPLWRRRFGTI